MPVADVVGVGASRHPTRSRPGFVVRTEGAANRQVIATDPPAGTELHPAPGLHHHPAHLKRRWRAPEGPPGRQRAGFEEDDLRAVANELGLWFSRKPPYEPVYVVPQLEVDGDGVVFAGRLASELREFTYLGRAYAETWAAGRGCQPTPRLERRTGLAAP